MSDAMTPDARFAWWLSLYHRLKPEDVEVTDVPGYWRIKKECHGECREGHTEPMRHAVHYRDGGDDSCRDGRGRFLSPYRTWRAHRMRRATP